MLDQTALSTAIATIMTQARTPDGDADPEGWEARRAGMRTCAIALGETLAQVRERTGRDHLSAMEIITACNALVTHYRALRDQTPRQTLLNSYRFYDQMLIGIIWVRVELAQAAIQAATGQPAFPTA